MIRQKLCHGGAMLKYCRRDLEVQLACNGNCVFDLPLRRRQDVCLKHRRDRIYQTRCELDPGSITCGRTRGRLHEAHKRFFNMSFKAEWQRELVIAINKYK